jgi:hypothetical protein
MPDHFAPFEHGRACTRHRRDLEVMSVIAQELGYAGAEDTLGAFGEFGDHLSGRACCPEQAGGLAGQDRRRIEVVGGDRLGQLLQGAAIPHEVLGPLAPRAGKALARVRIGYSCGQPGRNALSNKEDSTVSSTSAERSLSRAARATTAS